MFARLGATVGGLFPAFVLVLLLATVLSPQFFLLAVALGGSEPSMFAEAPAVVAGSFRTTLLLGALTVAFSLAIGTFGAYCTTRLDLPFRRAFSVLLCLPFAVPPVITAGVYQRFHDLAPGIVPGFDHVLGGAFLLALALYPWAYLPLKVHFSEQSGRYGELAETLGLGPRERFWRIELPLIGPTLVVSALLVLMEVLSDVGVATLLGLKTVSVVIHDAMFTMYRRDWAAQLSLATLLIPLAAAVVFMIWYRKRAVYNPRNARGNAARRPLSAGTRAAATGALAGIVMLGFGLPVGALTVWTAANLRSVSLAGLGARLADSLILIGSVAIPTLALSVAVHLLLRFRANRGRGLWHACALAFNLNYAVPTVMLGVALLFLSSDLPAGILSDSVVVLVVGACLTFLCFPFLALYSGFAKLNPRIDDLARLCPMSWLRRVLVIYAPLLRGALACGLLLVIVNVAKELTLSEVLQPFGFKTLSMRVFDYAKLGALTKSAPFALCLILLVVYPVVRLDDLITGTPHAQP